MLCDAVRDYAVLWLQLIIVVIIIFNAIISVITMRAPCYYDVTAYVIASCCCYYESLPKVSLLLL